MAGYLTPDEHPCNFGIGLSTALRPLTNVSRTRNRRLSTRKFSGHEHEAAVYDERLAGRVRRFLRGEEGDPGGDLACVSGMSQGQVRTFDGVWVRILGACHRGGDLAGSDGVDQDAVWGELHRHDLRQQAQTSLRSAVGRRADARYVLVYGGDIFLSITISLFLSPSIPTAKRS